MDYNYHAHTFRCHHATGTPEEYILRAIENGIKYMGFSDHAPFVFPDGYQSFYRVSAQEANNYFSELYTLRDKYQDKIDIKIGFEMEYYPKYFSDMLKTALDFGAEYLILGHHCLFNERPEGFWSTHQTDNSALLREYVSNVSKAIKTGVFAYVAHPDIFNFTGDLSTYADEMRKLCVTSRQENVPLEINCLGLRDNRHYPRDAFWKIAGEEKSPVTIGFDSHDIVSAFDGESLIRAKELIKKFGLNYIGKPEIKLLKE